MGRKESAHRAATPLLALGFVVALPGIAAQQSLPIPEYYGVFLWDGSQLRDLESQKVSQRRITFLSTSKTTTGQLRPSLVLFDRSLRMASPTVEVSRLAHVTQYIQVSWGSLTPDNASCKPIDGWIQEERIATKLAPAGVNPEMVRVVFTDDLQPGWYSLEQGESEYVFGVRVQALGAGTDMELVQEVGNYGFHLAPAGTYKRKFPGAGTHMVPPWQCTSKSASGAGSDRPPPASQAQPPTSPPAQQPAPQGQQTASERGSLPAGFDSFAGQWTNEDASTRYVRCIELIWEGAPVGRFQIVCGPRADFVMKGSLTSDGAVVLSQDLGWKRETAKCTMLPDGRMRLDDDNQYTDQRGHRIATYFFVKQR